jgi:hypothetical protein
MSQSNQIQIGKSSAVSEIVHQLTQNQRDWNRPGYYEPYYVTSYIPEPTWADAPFYPIITIEAPQPVAPLEPYDVSPSTPIPFRNPKLTQKQPGCQAVETTMHSETITEATYTSTITDAPDGAVTVYSDVDGQEYTYGASTIYEVYIYTTTQSIDLVGPGLECPAIKQKKMKKMRRTPRTMAARAMPAFVEARATPAA